MLLSPRYIAGLFDGEGSFRIGKNKGVRYGRPYQYQASAHITLREQFILDSICERYGGTVVRQKRRSENHNFYYHWRVSDRKLSEFLLHVGPHLILKRPQYLVVLDFVRYKTTRGYGPLSDSEYDFYENSFKKLKELNIRGDTSKYPQEPSGLNSVTMPLLKKAFIDSGRVAP